MQQVFARHILPKLALKDIAAAGSTCKALRDTVNEQDGAWTAAAAQYLPPQHPTLSGKAILSLLSFCLDSCAGLMGLCKSVQAHRLAVMQVRLCILQQAPARPTFRCYARL